MQEVFAMDMLFFIAAAFILFFGSSYYFKKSWRKGNNAEIENLDEYALKCEKIDLQTQEFISKYSKVSPDNDYNDFKINAEILANVIAIEEHRHPDCKRVEDYAKTAWDEFGIIEDDFNSRLSSVLEIKSSILESNASEHVER